MLERSDPAVVRGERGAHHRPLLPSQGEPRQLLSPRRQTGNLITLTLFTGGIL